MKHIKATVATLALVSLPVTAHAATIIYSTSGSFGAAISNSIVDDYENPGYSFVQSDAAMSAVLGETKYTTTGYQNNNIVFGNSTNKEYCGGCNGSFVLDFSSTSISSGGTVFGAGFNFRNNVFNDGGYTAFVTFGDNSTADYLSTSGPAGETGFFGVTSTLGIKTIYVGLSGAPTTAGGAVIDNLTIGQAGMGIVPEPATWAMMIFGFGMAGAAMRRRNTSVRVGFA